MAMAPLNKKISLVVCFLVWAFLPTAFAEMADLDIPSPETVNAFKQFHQSFEEYENKILKEGKEKHQKTWQKIHQEHVLTKKKYTKEQLEILKTAAEKYKAHLESDKAATNRPYILYNLAQILNLIAQHLEESDLNGSTFYRHEALNKLREIEVSHKDFAQREDALYLRALILEALKERSAALTVWRFLATISKDTIFGVHANIALGDYYFANGDAGSALEAYRRAAKILPNVKIENQAFEEMRLNYRLAWAAYKSGELEQVITAATPLLKPEIPLVTEKEKHDMVLDATELIGDALYEADDDHLVIKTLEHQALASYADAIGLRLLARYCDSLLLNRAIHLGEFLISRFTLSQKYPEILQNLALAYKKGSKRDKFLNTLEKLAVLLPEQSLWRNKYKNDYPLLQEMEKNAEGAANTVATNYYEIGLKTGDSASFLSAATFYRIMVDFKPNDPQSNDWRLKEANCYYFADHLKQAEIGYKDLIEKLSVEETVYQIASYQLVLTYDKKWRYAFSKATNLGLDPTQDKDTQEALADLEKQVENFANRFPTQNRSADLLLVAASANRDMERYQAAEKYWQRVLLLECTPSQRGIAIRGILIANLKSGSSGRIVEVAQKFLKLEDWSRLAPNLAGELKGVLSTATLEEATKLNNKGEVEEAGNILVNVAERFPDVPQRDHLLRDGAYMLAIAGNWKSAKEVAERYLKTKMGEVEADMLYLLGRANEFQLKLQPAAKAYLSLGTNYPRHSRAEASLNRAEALAASENDYLLAASAVKISGDREKNRKIKAQKYRRAMDYYLKAGKPDLAAVLAKKSGEVGNSVEEKLRADLLEAKAMFDSGREVPALRLMERTATKAENLAKKRGSALSRSVMGEANYLLGEEASQKCDDFVIKDRSGSISQNIAVKQKYFQELTSRYQGAISSKNPEWSAKARERLAEQADKLANELAELSSDSKQMITLREQQRYYENIKQLQKLSRSMRGENLISHQKDRVASMENNSMNGFGNGSSSGSAKGGGYKVGQEPVPSAVNYEIPYQWGM